MIDLVHDWGGFRVKTGLVYTDPGTVMYELIGFIELIFTLAAGVSSPVGMELDIDDGESRALHNPLRTYPTLSATQVRSGHSD